MSLKAHLVSFLRHHLAERGVIANIIVWPKKFECFRPLVLGSRFVGVSGKLQCESRHHTHRGEPHRGLTAAAGRTARGNPGHRQSRQYGRSSPPGGGHGSPHYAMLPSDPACSRATGPERRLCPARQLDRKGHAEGEKFPLGSEPKSGVTKASAPYGESFPKEPSHPSAQKPASCRPAIRRPPRERSKKPARATCRCAPIPVR